MSFDRNAPCRCGSGKKYKKCCQGRDEILALDRVAQAALDEGETDRAIRFGEQLLRQGVSLTEDDEVRDVLVDSAGTVVSLLRKGGQGERAIALLRMLAQTDQHNRVHWLQFLGETLIGEGHGEEGLARVAEGVSLAPHDPVAHILYAHALMDLDRFDEALQATSAGLQVDKAGRFHSDLYEIRSDIYERLSRFEEAEAEFKLACQADPEATRRGWAIGLMWLRAGVLERARSWAESAPGERRAYLEGLAAWVEDDYEQARERWAGILKRRPESKYLDDVWVDVHTLAGDPVAVARYLNFHPDVRSEQHRNWLQGLLKKGPSGQVASEVDPGTLRLDRVIDDLMHGEFSEQRGRKLIAQACEEGSAELVSALFRRLERPPHPEREMAQACLAFLPDEREITDLLVKYREDMTRPAGVRALVSIALVERGRLDERVLHRDRHLFEALIRYQSENTACTIEETRFAHSWRNTFAEMERDLQLPVLEALTKGDEPERLAFLHWISEHVRHRELMHHIRPVMERTKRSAEEWKQSARDALVVSDYIRAVACLELAEAAMEPGDPRIHLMRWQQAQAMLEVDDESALLILEVIAGTKSYPALLRHRAKDLVKEMREAIRKGQDQYRVPLDPVGQILVTLGEPIAGGLMTDCFLALWDTYLQFTHSLPPHLDSKETWAVGVVVACEELIDRGAEPTLTPDWDLEFMAQMCEPFEVDPQQVLEVLHSLWTELEMGSHPGWLLDRIGWTEERGEQLEEAASQAVDIWGPILQEYVTGSGLDPESLDAQGVGYFVRYLRGAIDGGAGEITAEQLDDFFDYWYLYKVGPTNDEVTALLPAVKRFAQWLDKRFGSRAAVAVEKAIKRHRTELTRLVEAAGLLRTMTVPAIESQLLQGAFQVITLDQGEMKLRRLGTAKTYRLPLRQEVQPLREGDVFGAEVNVKGSTVQLVSVWSVHSAAAADWLLF